MAHTWQSGAFGIPDAIRLKGYRIKTRIHTELHKQRPLELGDKDVFMTHRRRANLRWIQLQRKKRTSNRTHTNETSKQTLTNTQTTDHLKIRLKYLFNIFKSQQRRVHTDDMCISMCFDNTRGCFEQICLAFNVSMVSMATISHLQESGHSKAPNLKVGPPPANVILQHTSSLILWKRGS